MTSCENQQQVGACPGVEPGTSRTLGEINRSPFPALFTSINSYLIHFPFPIDVYHKMPPIWHSSTTFWKISLLSFGQVKNLSPFQGRGKDGAVVRALAALPPMWPEFKSWRRRYVWVGSEFVVGSLLCSQRFFFGYSGFPLSLKTNIFKFQFDQESDKLRATE